MREVIRATLSEDRDHILFVREVIRATLSEDRDHI